MSCEQMPKWEVQRMCEVGLGDPAPECTHVHDDQTLTLTERGLRYAVVCSLMHFISDREAREICDIASWNKLRDKILRVQQIRRADLDEKNRTGRVPVKRREIANAARLTPDALHAAMERRLAAEAAGQNVIPVTFQRADRTRR